MKKYSFSIFFLLILLTGCSSKSYNTLKYNGEKQYFIKKEISNNSNINYSKKEKINLMLENTFDEIEKNKKEKGIGVPMKLQDRYKLIMSKKI